MLERRFGLGRAYVIKELIFYLFLYLSFGWCGRKEMLEFCRVERNFVQIRLYSFGFLILSHDIKRLDDFEYIIDYLIDLKIRNMYTGGSPLIPLLIILLYYFISNFFLRFHIFFLLMIPSYFVNWMRKCF